MKSEMIKTWRHARRIRRVRKSVVGLQGRPRLAVARSLRHICALIIVVDAGRTL